MSYLGSWKIDDLLTFVVNTQVFATGVATDADAVPAYRVYEDETGTPILTGTMALLDSANTEGFYSEQITLSAANGFEKGKCYSIYISATVSSVVGATNRTFQIQAETAVASINASAITETAIAADAITDAKVASDVTIASVTGAVGSVTGAVGSVTGNVGGNVTGTIGGLTAAAIKDFFDTDSTTTYASSVAGSVVKEIADNAGGSSLTVSDIADEVETRTIAAVTTVNGLAANSVTAAALAADAGTEIGTAVWASATRLLTAGTNIALAKGTGVTGFNDLSAAQVNAEADTALADYDTPTHAELTAELATSDDAVLAQVALVKAKTDSLTFTVSGQADVNITHVNATQVTGDGGAGTEWGPV